MASEVALVRLATTGASLIYRAWARRSQLRLAATTNFDQLLAGRSFNSAFQKTRARHRLDEIAELLAEKLQPLFTSEYSSLETNDKEAAFLAVADRLERCDLSGAAYLEMDLDPVALEAQLRILSVRGCPQLAALRGLAERPVYSKSYCSMSQKSSM